MRLIARPPRKNGARRAAGALLAALVLLCACAQIESTRAPAEHVVRPGDTLGLIAAGYDISVDRLAQANRLDRSDRIAPGQHLRIPDGARIIHRVRRGETLQQIASLYRVRVSTIAQLNRVGRFPQLEVGQRLVLPREATLPAPPPDGLVQSPPVAARAVAPPVPSRKAEPRPAARPVEPEPPKAEARPAPPPPEPAPPPASDPDIERARALVDRSVDDYRSARFERALAHASEAETLLARSEDPDTRALGARAVFVTGSSLAALGETDRAKAAFARVHALDPEFEPPKGWLSPRLKALYLAARPD